jgi:plasmid stabilization system protein ParE
MNYSVRELPKALNDKRSIFLWLRERSPVGAETWLRAYDAVVDRLARDAESFGDAPESPIANLRIQQVLFKTRRGRVYRVLYYVEQDTVYILRVRGPGQAPVNPEEM